MRLVADLTAGFRRLPRIYWFLWVGMLVNRTGAFVLPFLTLFLTKQRGFDVETAGLALTAFGAGSIGAAFFGGQLVDRWGRRPVILISMSCGALALGALVKAGDLQQTLLATIAFGFFADLYRPAVSAAVADVVPPADRPFAYATLYWAYNLGFAIAPFMGGMLAETLGYTVLFIGDAATMLACGVLIFALVPETRPASTRPATFNPWDSDVLRDRPFLLFLFASCFVGLLLTQVGTVLPVRMAIDGISETTFGRIVACNGLIVVLLQPPLTQRLAKLPRQPVLMGGALLLGFGFWLHSLAHAPLEHLGALAVWTIGEIAVLPLGSAVVADLAPTDQRGRYQGAYMMTWSMANFAGPMLATQLFGSGGAWTWGIACAAAGLTSAIGFGLLRPRRAEDAR